MIKNSIIAAILILIASLCFFNTTENYMEISGTNAKHAYLPQTYKNEMSIRNFKPHGSTQNEEVRQLETFNYNPKNVRNNIREVDQQFKSLEKYQQKNNRTRMSKNTPNNLPKHNLSETYIPQRPDYELSRGVGISAVTPSGYRNGARPSTGVDLIRGGLFEGYSFPQFGSPDKPAGNIRTRGNTQNPDPRGQEQTSGRTQTDKHHSGNTDITTTSSNFVQDPRKERYVPNTRRRGSENFVPKANRRGQNTELQGLQQFKQDNRLMVGGPPKQQFRQDNQLMIGAPPKQQFRLKHPKGKLLI